MKPQLESSVTLAIQHRRLDPRFLWKSIRVFPPIQNHSDNNSPFNASPPIDTSLSLIPSDVKSCVDCGITNFHSVNRADIVHGVFLCTPCAKLHKSILPGPHRSSPSYSKMTTNLCSHHPTN